MGIFNSKNIDLEKEKYLNLYKKELMFISNIIDKMIINESKEPKFRNEEYNFLSKDTCNNYALVFKENLNALPKIHLKDLASDILIVPNKNDLIPVGKYGVREKRELCTRIYYIM